MSTVGWFPAELDTDPDAALFWCCYRCDRPNWVATEPVCPQCGRPPRDAVDRLRVALAGRPTPEHLDGLCVALQAARAAPDPEAHEALAGPLAALQRSLERCAAVVATALAELQPA